MSSVCSSLPTWPKHKMMIISPSANQISDGYYMYSRHLESAHKNFWGQSCWCWPPASWTAVLMAGLLFVIIIRLNNSCNRHSRAPCSLPLFIYSSSSNNKNIYYDCKKNTVLKPACSESAERTTSAARSCFQETATVRASLIDLVCVCVCGQLAISLINFSKGTCRMHSS